MKSLDKYKTTLPPGNSVQINVTYSQGKAFRNPQSSAIISSQIRGKEQRSPQSSNIIIEVTYIPIKRI